MTPTDLHERLDHAGLLDAAHGPGVYGLELDTPDSVEDIYRRWFGYHDTAPGDGELTRLAHATDVAYVGASKEVYARLMDHADGDVRQSAYLRVFDIIDVIDVWPTDAPFDRERPRADTLAGGGWTVVCDGEVIG